MIYNEKNRKNVSFQEVIEYNKTISTFNISDLDDDISGRNNIKKI